MVMGEMLFFASAPSSPGWARAAVRELYASTPMLYSSVTVKYPEAQTRTRGKKRKGKRDKSRRNSCLLTREKSCANQGEDGEVPRGLPSSSPRMSTEKSDQVARTTAKTEQTGENKVIWTLNWD